MRRAEVEFVASAVLLTNETADAVVIRRLRSAEPEGELVVLPSDVLDPARRFAGNGGRRADELLHQCEHVVFNVAEMDQSQAVALQLQQLPTPLWIDGFSGRDVPGVAVGVERFAMGERFIPG